MKTTITDERPKKKNRGKIAILIILIFFVGVFIIAGIQGFKEAEKLKTGETPPLTEQVAETTDLNNSEWVNQAANAAKEYLNQYYNNGETLTYHPTQERAWFVDLEYDYGQDDYYLSDDFTYGYYVCEGAFDYDIPGDGKAEAYMVNYTTTVFITDNANGYRWSLRTITLTYDGMEIDTYKSEKFFSE